MGEISVTKRDQIETNLRKLGGAHAEASVKYVCGKGYFANTKLGVLFFATAAHAVNYIHQVKTITTKITEPDSDFALFAAFDLGAAARQRDRGAAVMTMPSEVKTALERLKGEVSHIIDEERRSTRLSLRSIRRHRVSQIARLNDALSVIEQLTNDKKFQAGAAAEITQSQRCPSCGSKMITFEGVQSDPIDGEISTYLCKGCGVGWGEIDEDDVQTLAPDSVDLDEECPFCGAAHTVLSGDHHHCNFCDSDFDENGEVVIDDDEDNFDVDAYSAGEYANMDFSDDESDTKPIEGLSDHVES
jgi:DNA-directed RNA polymerase subunit M/transcription elongation factor TFIIS